MHLDLLASLDIGENAGKMALDVAHAERPHGGTVAKGILLCQAKPPASASKRRNASGREHRGALRAGLEASGLAGPLPVDDSGRLAENQDATNAQPGCGRDFPRLIA